MIITSLIKAVVGYFVLMFVETNLIGFIVRQLFEVGLTDDLNQLKAVFKSRLRFIDVFVSFFFSIISIAYLFALFYYFNLGVALAGVMLMFTRLPDILFEIKMGQKITFQNMPKNPFDYFCAILQWTAFPLLWYSLYRLQNPNSFF
jgi:hypothetical protein